MRLLSVALAGLITVGGLVVTAAQTPDSTVEGLARGMHR
jgi:hypothetical protein